MSIKARHKVRSVNNNTRQNSRQAEGGNGRHKVGQPGQRVAWELGQGGGEGTMGTQWAGIQVGTEEMG